MPTKAATTTKAPQGVSSHLNFLTFFSIALLIFSYVGGGPVGISFSSTK